MMAKLGQNFFTGAFWHGFVYTVALLIHQQAINPQHHSVIWLVGEVGLAITGNSFLSVGVSKSHYAAGYGSTGVWVVY